MEINNSRVLIGGSSESEKRQRNNLAKGAKVVITGEMKKPKK
jgi:hypothetical protein